MMPMQLSLTIFVFTSAATSQVFAESIHTSYIFVYFVFSSLYTPKGKVTFIIVQKYLKAQGFNEEGDKMWSGDGKPMTHVANCYHKDIQACVRANRIEVYEKDMGIKGKVGMSVLSDPLGGAYNTCQKTNYVTQDPGFVTIKPGRYFGFAESGPDGKVYVTIKIGSDVSHTNFQVYNGHNVLVDKDGSPINAKKNDIWTDTSGKKHTMESPAGLDLERISLGKSHPAEDSGEALQRYLNKGQVKKYFGTEGKCAGQMTGPIGICTTAADNIVVADSGNNRIQIFDVNGQVKVVFGSKGTSEGQFDHVSDVCVTSQGQIVASDARNHRIQIFDEQGKFVRTFGSKGSGDGELDHPVGVATDDKDLIYVCDCRNQRVQVFSEGGKFVRKFGSKGYLWLSVSNGRVVVSDFLSNRVQVFDSYGGRLFQFGSEGTDECQFKGPMGIVTDDHGNIIVADHFNHRVQVFTSSGAFVSCFGSVGSDPGQIAKPRGICLLSDGGIAVCDSVNNRIQIF